MYKHYHYEFTEREIEQIVALLTAWPQHDLHKPVDARKLSSRQVRQWATGLGFLEWRNQDGKCYSCDKGARLYYCDALRYGFPFAHIPVEVLWRIVAPMLEQSRGYGIIRNPAWLTLNIDPVVGRCERDAASRENSIKEMQEVLSRLATWGYIYYQYGGSVWAIDVIKRAAA